MDNRTVQFTADPEPGKDAPASPYLIQLRGHAVIAARTIRTPKAEERK